MPRTTALIERQLVDDLRPARDASGAVPRDSVSTLACGSAEIRRGSILDPRPELPRPLRDAERETLTAVLGFADFPGRDELWAQAADAVVVGYCGCGCASVRLGVSPDAPRAPRHPGPIPVHALVIDKLCHPIGRVVVYVAAPGRLWLLEAAGRDEPIRSLPTADELLFESSRPLVIGAPV